MFQPPDGWTADPANPGWWLDPNGDAAKDTSWWQAPPADWVEDPANPGWAYNPQGDVTRPENWWFGGRVQKPETPAKVEHQVKQVPAACFTNGRSRGAFPIAIVIHTMGGTLPGCDSWFQNPQSQVSAHYGIGQDTGEIHQYVQEQDTAWANGVLESGNRWFGTPGVNPNAETISIETEDFKNGDLPVSDAMFESVRWLCVEIMKRWPSVKYLTTHTVISPKSRAYCPGNRWVSQGRLAEIAALAGLELRV